MEKNKKILFLNYAHSDPNDSVLYRNLYLHLSILNNKIEAWSKDKILAGDEKDNSIQNMIKKSDAVVHLLSVNFGNKEECLELFKQSVEHNKKNIPVLISSFPWEEYNSIFPGIEEKILPGDQTPIDLQPNTNKVLSDIVQKIKAEVTGVNTKKERKMSDRLFYYILSGIVAVMGIFSTVFVHSKINEWNISILVALMFVCIILIILRKIIFPTNVASLK